MPIERRDSTTQVRAMAIAVVSVLFAVVLGYAAIRSFSGRKSSVVAGRAADARFSVDVDAVAPHIVDGPVLFPDAGTGGQRRPIFVYHQGSDTSKGWSAYVAVPPGAPKDCFLTWDRPTGRLRAPCNGATYPPDGEGLTLLPTETTKDGRLLIDLSPPGS